MLRVRPVTDEDCRLLWGWVNDPGVREAAFRSHAISWEEHEAWFRAKRADTRCVMYIVLDQAQRPVGQVRFDVREDGVAEISISMAAEHRGKGYGAEAIRIACASFARATGVTQGVAYIKPWNTASVRAFAKAGFAALGRRQVRGHEAVGMRLDMSRLPVGTNA